MPKDATLKQSDWLIVATPPTPNGDLHVGHMSGPYLAAEIFRAARQRLGDTTAYICYGDDHQSYVVTTAKRLSTDPNSLMENGNASIRKTLDAYGIGMDAYSRPDADHDKAVSDTISLLIEKGLIVERECPQLYDKEQGQPLYEAFAEGHCNKCLLKTKGGICESCGHPNDPIDLLDDSGQSISEGLVVRQNRRLVLPIEDYRDELIEFYSEKRGHWRPHLIQLVDELLSAPLADYPISHESNWGIPINQPTWGGHVINVWAEMGLGLVEALGKFRTADEMQRGRYVQFLGYDNSYFFSIVHPALQFALRRLGQKAIQLPEFIFTNEFYNLENSKFSTSQGHAIWGRELLDTVSADEARFYLSLHGPELAESNFVLDAAVTDIERELRKPFAQLMAKIETLSGQAVAPSGAHDPVVAQLDERFAFFSEPQHFSSRALATQVRNTLAYLAQYPTKNAELAALQRFSNLARFWVGCCGVFCPKMAQQVQTKLDKAVLEQPSEAMA